VLSVLSQARVPTWLLRRLPRAPERIASSYANVAASYEMFFLNRLRQQFSRDTAGRVPNENLGRRISPSTWNLAPATTA
jgi:hypothetical protein